LSHERRVKFTLQLTYGSQSKNILKIKYDEIKSVIEKNTETSDEMTVHFTDFDSSSLNILVIYFVKSNIYDAMARVKEEINVQILEIVEQNNCQFAYPTQTVF